MATKSVSLQTAISIKDRSGNLIPASVWRDAVERILKLESPLFHAGFIKFYQSQKAGTIEIPTARKIVLGVHSDANAKAPANFGAEITRIFLDQEISRTAKISATDEMALINDAGELKAETIAHWTNQQMRLLAAEAYLKIKTVILDKTKWEIVANSQTGQEAITAGDANNQFNPTFKLDTTNTTDFPAAEPSKLINLLMDLKIDINRLVDLFVSGIPNEEIVMIVSPEVFQKILAAESQISHDVGKIKDYKQGQALNYQGITIYSDILLGKNWPIGSLHTTKAYALYDVHCILMTRNSFYSALGYTLIFESKDPHTQDPISGIRFVTGNAFPVHKIKQFRLGLKSGKKTY